MRVGTLGVQWTENGRDARSNDCTMVQRPPEKGRDEFGIDETKPSLRSAPSCEDPSHRLRVQRVGIQAVNCVRWKRHQLVCVQQPRGGLNPFLWHRPGASPRGYGVLA